MSAVIFKVSMPIYLSIIAHIHKMLMSDHHLSQHAHGCIAAKLTNQQIPTVTYVYSSATYVYSPATYVISPITYVISSVTYVISLVTYVISPITYVISLVTYVISPITYVHMVTVTVSV